MKTLKELIDSKQWAAAKAYVIDNRERIEEIADTLLGEIERISPKQLRDYANVYVDLHGADIPASDTVQTLVNQTLDIKSGILDSEGNELTTQDWYYLSYDDHGRPFFTKEKPEHYSRFLNSYQVDESKNFVELIPYGYRFNMSSTALDLPEKPSWCEDEYRNFKLSQIEDRRSNGTLPGTNQAIINALMELETVVHAEVTTEDRNCFRTVVHVADESQLEEIASTIHDNRPFTAYSTGGHWQEFKLIDGRISSERFDFMLTNSI